MSNAFIEEASAIIERFPNGRRVVIIGSAAFWGADSEALCQRIAEKLAPCPELIAITGGVEGVGVTFGRAFVSARQALGQPEHLFHLVPHGRKPCDHGATLSAGGDFFERREILGRVGHVYVVLEGGPGTKHEASVAADHGARLIAIARTGGHAGELFPQLTCPRGAAPSDWKLLADATAPLDDVATAIVRLVCSNVD